MIRVGRHTLAMGWTGRRPRLVVAVAVLAVAASMGTVVTAAAQSDTGSAAFERTTYTDERGDVIRVDIVLTNTETATVTVGDAGDNNWVQNVTVRDGDGDGTVTLLLNTYTAGTSDDGNTVYAVAGDGDSVENVATAAGPFDPATPREMTLAEDDYRLAVVAGTTPAEQTPGGADDDATLSLQARSTDSVETYVAPDSRRDDIDSVDSIAQLQASDNVTAASAVATDDILLVRLDADGLQGVLRHELDTGARNVTDAFFRASNAESATPAWHVTITQTSSGADSETLRLNRTNTVVFDDPETGTYWLRIDTARVEMETGAVEDGDEFETNVTVLADSGLATQSETVLDSWTLTDAGATVDVNADTDDDGTIDEVAVQRAAGQAITGTTTVAPGTELTVRVTGTDSGSPFVKPLTARVLPDGSWRADADFSDNAQGANFSVEVRRGSESLLSDSVDGRIAAAPTASVTFNDQASFGDSLTVASVTLSDGGFVALHRDNASGTVIGTSDYIAAGSDSDISISLDTALSEDTTVVAMPHQDTDGDERYEFAFGSSVDAPYTENGSAVTDEATISVTSPFVANFSVAITGTNAPVDAGEPLNVTVAVENVGSTRGTQQVTLRDGDGVTVDQESITLAADTSTTTTLSWTTGESAAGDPTVTVASANDTASRTVTVEAVNDPPVASGDEYTVQRNETLTVAAPGILDDDTDPDGDSLSASLVSGPDNGSLTLSADGSFTYTPDTGVTGTDTFTYEVSDGDAGTDTATVTVSVFRSTFAVTNVSSNTPVEAGDRLRLDATVENRGSVTDTQSIALRRPDGTPVDSATLSLDPNASAVVTLTWDTSPGDATDDAVTVATATNATRYAVVVEEATADGGGGNDGGGTPEDSDENASEDDGGDATGDGDGPATETATSSPTPASTDNPTEGIDPTETAVPSGGGEPRPAATDATARSPPLTSNATDATTTAGSGPGVGLWTVLLAVVATLALAHRRN